MTELKKRLITVLPLEKEMQVDLTVHGISADLVEEFAIQIVKPFYAGNLSEALKDLIQKAVTDQEFVENHKKIG